MIGKVLYSTEPAPNVRAVANAERLRLTRLTPTGTAAGAGAGGAAGPAPAHTAGQTPGPGQVSISVAARPCPPDRDSPPSSPPGACSGVAQVCAERSLVGVHPDLCVHSAWGLTPRLFFWLAR